MTAHRSLDRPGVRRRASQHIETFHEPCLRTTRDRDVADRPAVHGTQEPVECMRCSILNNSSPGQAVYEPFMGSGTTLIAAETTRRVCFGIELNPVYVDVAVERWQQFSGTNAVPAETGKTVADLKVKRLG
ncbi:MAG: DNA methyltransferase [Hyphomonas sp.]